MIMKKLLFILCLFSMTAHAEWAYFNYSDTATHYIDYSRTKTEGRYKSMWVLADLKSPKIEAFGKQYKSQVTKDIIDCQGSRIQSVGLYFYSEQMGKGEIVWSNSRSIQESEWTFPPPNSINEALIKAACVQKQTPPPVIAPVVPKQPPSNPQDNKRQRCINLGLAPNSADFQQCMK